MAFGFIRVPQNTPSVRKRVLLDGREYVLRLQWNMRSGWYIALADQDDSPIFGPRKLVPDWSLLASSRHDARCPPGRLACVDLSGAGLRPERLDLCSTFNPPDARCALVYVPVGDL